MTIVTASENTFCVIHFAKKTAATRMHVNVYRKTSSLTGGESSFNMKAVSARTRGLFAHVSLIKTVQHCREFDSHNTLICPPEAHNSQVVVVAFKTNDTTQAMRVLPRISRKHNRPCILH